MSEIRFGDYRITGTIGSGAISTISKAVQEPLGRVVALKALKAQIAPTSSFGEQLDREAKILADLAHLNVVLLLDAGRTDSGRPYVVLEYVDGPALEALLTSSDDTARRTDPAGDREGRGHAELRLFLSVVAGAALEHIHERGIVHRDVKPSNVLLTSSDDTARRTRDKGQKKPKLGVASALAIACGICAALEHIHERGIVHRDVKPSNVLLSRSGHVKVIDFGIAQRPRTLSVSDTLGTEGITASGRMAPEPLKDAFGTPAYMSPEQILGDFVDGRSDLFSLGVILYQMLSGSRPFETPEGSDPKRSAAQRIRRDAPAPLRERAPHCPRAVERIVMRLLEKSPNDRYPSAGVVKERLESALRAETREDPSALVRRALAVAGLGPKDEPAGRNDGHPLRSASGVRGPTRSSIGVSKALLGFALVTATFAAGVVANEGTNVQAREARAAGAHTLELAPDRAGGLRVVATPWAFVRVDGQLVETTPFARPIPLAAGKHFVTLTHPDAPSAHEREITIVTGETVTLDVTMNVASEDAGKGAR